MSIQTLDYGRSTHLDWKRPACWTVAALVCLVVIIASMREVYDWHYYRPLREVEAGLAGTPGITYRTFGGDIGDFEYYVDHVVIHVGGDPSKPIILHQPNARSFEGTDHLTITQFGHLTFEWTRFEHAGGGRSRDGDPWRARGVSAGLDIGKGGRFASVLPLPREVRTVQDLVTHYDELLAAMEQWPRTASVPLGPSTPLLRYRIDVADTPERGG